MKVKRDKEWYNVIEFSFDSVCIECEFDFAQKPHKRILKLWWNWKYIEDVKI